MGDPEYQARAIAAIRGASIRTVDAYDELLALWRLDGEPDAHDSRILSLVDGMFLDTVWTVLRCVATDPDLVAALNNVAHEYALRGDHSE